MEVLSTGEGRRSMEEVLRSKQDHVLIGAIKVRAVDEKNGLVSDRTKWFFVKFIGTGASPIKKAKMSSAGNDAQQFFGNLLQYNLNVSGDEIDTEFSAEALAKKMLAAGGAHKPEYYAFGGDEKVATADLYF